MSDFEARMTRQEQPSDAFELLAEFCRDHAATGFTVPAGECLRLSWLFDRLATRATVLESVERTAKARAVAETVMAAQAAAERPIGVVEVVDIAAFEAAVLGGPRLVVDNGRRL